MLRSLCQRKCWKVVNLMGCMRTFSSKRPLEGFRVIECGHLIAGPFTGTILGYYGAEIIKIEPLVIGDQLRQYRTMDMENPDDPTSVWWYSTGRNKKSVCIDLKKKEGQALVRELICSADVLIENFKPGTMEEWGLGPQIFEELHPKLVYTRISGYGQNGPYASKPGFASVCEAMGGFRYLNGFPGGMSVRPNLSLGDTLAAVHAVIGTTIALLGRKNLDGKGQVVDVAIYEAVFNMLEGVITEYDYDGSVRGPSGSTLTGIVPSNTYLCRDGKAVVIGANTDTLFRLLMDIIGHQEMADNPKYATNYDRVRWQEDIDRVIGEWTANYNVDRVVSLLEEAKVPVGLIYNAEDMVNDTQYKTRKMFEEVQIPSSGDTRRTIKVPAIVPRLSKTPGRTDWAGPSLGENTLEVLEHILGKSREAIGQLEANRVIRLGSTVSHAT